MIVNISLQQPFSRYISFLPMNRWVKRKKSVWHWYILISILIILAIAAIAYIVGMAGSAPEFQGPIK